jgi:hypothetical protein
MNDGSLLHTPSYFALNLFSVSEIDTMGQANVVGTGRYQSIVHPVMTEIALPGDNPVMIKGDSIIGTGLYTFLTSRTSIIIHHHNSVFSFGNGLLKARFRAGRIITVPAYIHLINKMRFPLYHSGAVFCHEDQLDALGAIEFLLAGRFTGLASPTGFMVYDEVILLHLVRPPFWIYHRSSRDHPEFSVIARVIPWCSLISILLDRFYRAVS